jgi:[amino group carrier protein]-L-2-aminoadipate 6-kinase
VVAGRRVVVRDDHSGRIEHVNTGLLHLLLDHGVVPVISPPATAEDGAPVNADADRVAAAIAGALGAAALVLLTGAPGVLADPAAERTLLPNYQLPQVGPPGHTGAGMGLKLIAAREALRSGVSQVVIADGRRAGPLIAALSGEGTAVTMAPQDQELPA